MNPTAETPTAAENAAKRLLIVEDERIVALDLRFNLEALGYNVIGMAASEGEALSMVENHRPDLVLMDINLGRGGDGTVAAQKISDAYGLPVVFLTAYAEPETLARASASAPYGYLLKPFDLRELNATIQVALSRWLQERRRDSMVSGFYSAPNAVMILDSDFRVHDVNPAFTRLTGWPEDEIAGKHPHEFLHAQREGDRLSLEPLGVAPVQQAGEVTCRRRDGSLFPAWEHIAVVQGPDPHYILTFSDITPLSDSRQRMTEQAHHDALTGLGNRYELDVLLDRLVGAGTRFALIFLDLDGFKTVNDREGHEAGDKVLLEVAKRLKGELRKTDTAIRLGGDEFVLVVPLAVQLEDLQRLAGQLLQSVRQPIQIQTAYTVQVSASMGIARYPEDGCTADALLRLADTAMYRAKSQGRNQFAMTSL
ncbi:MAG: hypothetical protein RL323_1813 [Pseudomonadota bacterium]